MEGHTEKKIAWKSSNLGDEEQSHACPRSKANIYISLNCHEMPIVLVFSLGLVWHAGTSPGCLPLL